MGMLGIVMHNSSPLQLSVEIALHPAHQIAPESFKINPLSKFRRNDQLEQARVAGSLPAVEGRWKIFDVSVAPESGLALRSGSSRAFSHEIAAMSPPLSFRRVSRIRDSDGTALAEAPRRRCALCDCGIALPAPAGHARDPHDSLQGDCPRARFLADAGAGFGIAAPQSPCCTSSNSAARESPFMLIATLFRNRS